LLKTFVYVRNLNNSTNFQNSALAAKNVDLSQPRFPGIGAKDSSYGWFSRDSLGLALHRTVLRPIGEVAARDAIPSGPSDVARMRLSTISFFWLGFLLAAPLSTSNHPRNSWFPSSAVADGNWAAGDLGDGWRQTPKEDEFGANDQKGRR
jgi:hypothetical protein